MEDFAACFCELDDPRRSNARHDLHEMLVIALRSKLCGGNVTRAARRLGVNPSTLHRKRHAWARAASP